MFRELSAAFRSVARRRGLAFAIGLTLALGIGANSAIFSAVDAVLLRPLPYPEADRLTAIYEANTRNEESTSLVALARLEDWNRLSRSFDGLAGSYFENMTDTTEALPERVVAMRTSPRFFSVLGTPAAVGRTPAADEEAFGGPAVVIVSDAFWRSRFNADPSVVGRVRVLGGVRRTIVGVMPPSFRYPTATSEVWIPAQASAGLLNAREARFYTAVGRLKPGVTVDQAQKDLASIQSDLGRQFPKTDQGWTASVVPLKEEQVGGIRRSLWLLFGAVLLVLFAACGNVACLLLADAARREQGVAIRFALGASRPTVVRELLLEGLILSLAGSIGGLLVARWGTDSLRAIATELPRAGEISMNLRLVAFTLAVGGLTTMVFALAPALHSTRSEVTGRVLHGARGQIGGRQLLQRALVTAQIALAIVLLVGAGLLVRSFARIQGVPPGFDPNHVLTFRVSASWGERPEAVANRQLRTLQRLSAIPGVTDTALDSFLPAGADWPPGEFKIVGRDTGEQYFAVGRQVSAAYFRTLRIPILQGTTCQDDPRVPPPAKAVVTRSFAERFFPSENPVGRQIVQRLPAEIVGVVADVRERGLMRDPEPTVYSCGLMAFWPDPYYLVRTDPSRAVTMTAIREALHEIEPRRAVYGAAALTERLAESLSQPRLNTILLTLFAVTALGLAAVGLYGTLAQFVAERRREIGLRMALGAAPVQVLAEVLRHATLVVGVGLVLGLASALAVGRFMTAMLFGVSTRDPVTFVVVPIVLTLIAAAAAIVPARRAIRVDPMAALRAD